MRRTSAVLAVMAIAVAVLPSSATGAPPSIVESWVTDVTATGANLRARVNPNGLSTTYRFEYIAETAYQANLKASQPGFSGASKAPPGNEAGAGASTMPLAVVQHVGGLKPVTTYRYRPLATNKDGTTIGSEHALTTQATSLVFDLPDNRAWEMVSPVEKGGGAVVVPEALFGGGAFQAAPGGPTVTYGSATSFGDAEGSPPASQYISRRTAAGWTTENVSAPLESGAYGDEPDGAPYRVFSADLARGLLFGGLACRGGLPGCPEPNPVLPGTGVPSGYMAYYLRDSATGAYSSLLSAADLAHTAVSPEAFEVSFAAASLDLSHVVLSSCAKLTANAIEEMTGPDECDPAAQNLYQDSASGLKLLNLLPGDTVGTPGAEIAAPIGAIAEDGSRVYWTQAGGLYLRQGTQTLEVEEAGASFETASTDGATAFFTEGGHLFRFVAATEATTDLTPSGGVTGVLGASTNGSRAYYQDGAGLKLWQNGTTTTVAPGASASAASNYPPATGTARVTPDGSHLAFLSTAELTLFDNAGATEAYLYGPPPGGGAPQLVCASCNPTGERPRGSASIPGAPANGTTHAYKPRALSADGTRLLFDSSDELVVQDTNSHPDVYQWEANGVGDCGLSPGCVQLISSGRSLDGAKFIDASASGFDVYFVTGESLLPNADPGSIDLYDARVDGGFAEAQKPIPCIGDACQSLPAPPGDPTPGTLVPNPGNPPLQIVKEKQKRKKKAKGKRRGRQKKGQRRAGKARR